MNKQEYFQTIELNKTKLVRLIEKFHPNIRPTKVESDYMDWPITAPNAEKACQGIRTEIRQYGSTSPITEFLEACHNENVERIVSILNETWFGMPESSAIHSEAGFYVLCDLCSDFPDEDEI